MNPARRLSAPALPVALGAALLATVAAGPARAEATAAQASAMETQIRAFIARQVGAVMDPSTLAMQVVPAGDSLKLTLPIGGSMARGLVDASSGSWSAQVRPMPDGRYAIEDMRLSTPMTFSATDKAGKAGSTTIKIAEQQATGVLDVSLATTSSLDVKLRGYSVTIDGADGPQTSHVENLTGRSAWLPKGGSRVDMTSNFTAEKYAIANRLADGSAMNVSADRLLGSAKMDNVDFDRLGQLVQTGTRLAASFKDKADADQPSPPQRAMMREMLAALGELMNGLSGEQTMQNVRVTAGGQTGTLKRLSLGMAAAAPGGMLEMRMPVALEGLESALIPTGAFRDLVPKLVTLTPRFGGVPKAELMAILNRALEADSPDSDAVQAELTEMVEKSPMTVAVDNLAIELSLASLRGGGEMRVSGMGEATGEGEFRMTGMDALIRRANTAPELKMAAPALIFLKGIGKADGKDMVWHISYTDKVLMVNDTNMTEMMPSK